MYPEMVATHLRMELWDSPGHLGRSDVRTYRLYVDGRESHVVIGTDGRCIEHEC